MIAALSLATACGGGKTPTSPTQPTSSAQTGAVRIVTTTTGKTLDPDGYSATVDGGSGVSVGINDTVRVTGLAAGVHQVELSGIASNCSVGADDPLGVTVTAGDTTDAAFDVSCELALRNQILFASARATGTVFDVYVMDADGSHPTRLTAFGAVEPKLSPDGTRIAFVGNSGIYTMKADGSDTTRLTTTPAQGFDQDPAWSPDGRRIAFARSTSGTPDLYVMNSDGSGLTQITHDTIGEGFPAWSPDGSTIAFSESNPQPGDIYLVNLDGTGLRDLTNDPDHQDLEPVYSADGSRIAFASVQSDGLEIWIMNADGSSPRRFFGGPIGASYPSWSPDDSKIAFQSGDFDVYSINLDGTGLVDLTNDPGEADANPFWCPK